MGSNIEKLGKSVTGVVRDYNAFVGSLEGRVLPQVRRIQRIDISKVADPAIQLDPEKTNVRELTAAEFSTEDEQNQ